MERISTIEAQYKLAELYDTRDALLEQSAGEVTDEVIDLDNQIEAMEALLDDRVAYYIDTVAKMQDENVGAKKRIDNIKKKIDSRESRIEQMLTKLESLIGHGSAETEDHKVKWTKSERLAVSDEIERAFKNGDETVIKKYAELSKCKQTTTWSIDKTVAKKWLKNGFEYDGISIETNWSAKVE